MKNVWVQNSNRRQFALAVKDLIMVKFGISKVKDLTPKQFDEVSKDIRRLYHSHGKPLFKKFSDIDSMQL